MCHLIYFTLFKKYWPTEKKKFELRMALIYYIRSQLWVHPYIQLFPSNMLYSKCCPPNTNFHHNYSSHHQECLHNHFTFFPISGPDHSFKTFLYNTASFVFQLIHRLAFLFVQSKPLKCSCFFNTAFKGIFLSAKSQFLFPEKHLRRSVSIVKHL